MKFLLSATFIFLGCTWIAQADEIGDALAKAQQHWADGDAKNAEAEIQVALQKLTALKTEALIAFLPEAQEGWTRTVEDDSGGQAAMALMGGGTLASARYSNDVETFTISLTTDSPLMEMFMGMFSNALTLSAMGTVEKIHDQDFLREESGSLTAVVGGKVLLQAGGSPPDVIRAHLEAMDLTKLAEF